VVGTSTYPRIPYTTVNVRRPKRPSWTSHLTKDSRTDIFTTCSVYLNMRNVGLNSLSKNITRAYGANSSALFTHPQTKPRALNTAPTTLISSIKSPKLRLRGKLINLQPCISTRVIPKREAQNCVCSLDKFLGNYGLNSTNSTDNTRFKLRYDYVGRQLAACFSTLLHLGGTWVSSCLTW
jgi:hypothetical protein